MIVRLSRWGIAVIGRIRRLPRHFSHGRNCDAEIIVLNPRLRVRRCSAVPGDYEIVPLRIPNKARKSRIALTMTSDRRVS